MYVNQMASCGYGNTQRQNTQFLTQEMYGLSMTDNGSSYPVSTPSYVPSGKPSKPQDKLFRDLDGLSKFKSTNGAPGVLAARDND
ncbi:hypothetical protein CQW23_14003 [Capsicum baccatum]|uniref:Uncharacterized protein n=1 Tax=Capsicum baccatum TaxID=33114 RepID=A0A2G2WHX3_CAPBA|nr:hypothetical protein CQW23_14003 [Capsicum baccatum]